MFSLLPTQKATVLIPIFSNGEDSFNEIIIEEYVEHTVSGCLILQTSTDDVRESGLELLDRSLITVHFPKAFNESLKEAIVVYKNNQYFVHGNPQKLHSPPLGMNFDRMAICEEKIL